MLQIEEDTDRDRYMSPLEAKNYGLIDEVIGGDEAGFQISGTTRDFPKTKEAYVNWVSRACMAAVQPCSPEKTSVCAMTTCRLAATSDCVISPVCDRCQP